MYPIEQRILYTDVGKQLPLAATIWSNTGIPNNQKVSKAEELTYLSKNIGWVFLQGPLHSGKSQSINKPPFCLFYNFS